MLPSGRPWRVNTVKVYLRFACLGRLFVFYIRHLDLFVPMTRSRDEIPYEMRKKVIIAGWPG